MPLQIPIFPLPLVLFPGTPQLLHIFEPRYRQMLDDCMGGDRRFGISWAEAKAGEDPEPAPGTVGCIAWVEARTQLPDGRSNILTQGDDRYLLQRYITTDRLYRVAEIEIIRDEPYDVAALTELADHVADSFRRLIAAVTVMTDSTVARPALSDDLALRSFQVAGTLDIPASAKQDILVQRAPRRRYEILDRILHQALAEIGPRTELQVRSRRNGKGGHNPSIVTDP